MSATDLHRTIEALWRIESARVIAGLTRLTRDVGLAEDLAQEALLLKFILTLTAVTLTVLGGGLIFATHRMALLYGAAGSISGIEVPRGRF